MFSHVMPYVFVIATSSVFASTAQAYSWWEVSGLAKQIYGNLNANADAIADINDSASDIKEKLMNYQEQAENWFDYMVANRHDAQKVRMAAKHLSNLGFRMRALSYPLYDTYGNQGEALDIWSHSQAIGMRAYDIYELAD